MTATDPARPLIWVLKGSRAGDTAQAMALALELGGRVEGRQLSFNPMHLLPNVFAGPRVSHLTPSTRALLRPPWPDVVVATGRRTAPVALWIKQKSAGRTRAVHIGRPRMALSSFDLVVTTPQYGLPACANVIEIPLPFASAKSVDADSINAFRALWGPLPKPHVLAVIGGGKFPLRLTASGLNDYGKTLNNVAKGGSVIILDSPRTPPGSIDSVRQALTVPTWLHRRGDGPNPYQAALALCDQLVVTSDSVMMVAEMLSTGKPTWVFRLAVSPFLPRWSAKSGIAAKLAERGILQPPRDVDGFLQNLLDHGFVGDLVTNKAPRSHFSASASHREVVTRIQALLRNSDRPDAPA
jgi:uncharacterized protein